MKNIARYSLIALALLLFACAQQNTSKDTSANQELLMEQNIKVPRTQSAAAEAPPATEAPPGFDDAEKKAPFNTESYALIKENDFRKVTDEPLSTFSIDVDNASYSNTRRFIL
jgi:Ca-activated chloride channel family protein